MTALSLELTSPDGDIYHCINRGNIGYTHDAGIQKGIKEGLSLFT